MAAAAAKTFCQESSELVGINFAGAASDGEFDLICTDIESKADIDILSLKSEVADKSQNTGIALLSLDDQIFVALVIFVVKDRAARDHELVERDVGVDHGCDGALVVDQGVHHISVERVRYF